MLISDEFQGYRNIRRHMPLFIAESCWKYNHRKDTNAFALFVRGRFA